MSRLARADRRLVSMKAYYLLSLVSFSYMAWSFIPKSFISRLLSRK